MSTFFSLVPNNVVQVIRLLHHISFRIDKVRSSHDCLQSFATPNIISVIIIAFVFGAAMVHVHNTEEGEYREENSTVDNATDPTDESRSSLSKSNKHVVHSFTPGAVLDICKEMTVICNLIIKWIVKLAPVCIAFLIAGSLAEAGEQWQSTLLCCG